MKITKSTNTKINDVNFNSIKFGEIFTDHMFECNFSNGSWEDPIIRPYSSLVLDPSTHVFHYGQSIFEGMKAYKDNNNDLWLFRPKDNYERLKKSSERMHIPVFPEEYFFNGLNELIKLEKDWISNKPGSSLYIRPFVFSSSPMLAASPSIDYKFLIICSPGASYYSKPLSVYIEDEYSRAAPGGAGYAKAAGNYGSAFYPTSLAISKGFDQIVWTDSNSHQKIEEVGTMSIAFRIGDKIVTPMTSDTILDSVTRKSVIQVAKDLGIAVEERDIFISELISEFKSGNLKEIFGCGTAAVIAPISSFGYKKERFELNKLEESYADQIKNSIVNIQQNLSKDLNSWKYKIKQ
ncbi:MAG: Branched-chain-amino-acid aminotransferase 2 [Flavobacteriales bacterium]|nr:MAG: Branched-chain-amino-acid aminotransferase 2 [Flavobacteriales bacterium]|tara:strand:- start:134 stop:1183 length:1050 start_codon:yes stop_codon:yes gene_type:complete